MMAGLDTEFEAALWAMEGSFHVRLIGTFAPDLVWAPPHVEATPWLAQNNPDFDQFPVKERDGTIGILLREGDHGGKTVREAMLPLREGLIVSADTPIADLIPQLRENNYRLVLRGGRIDGLVTQSDLLKLPVRMLLFGLISHLELCLRALIRERAPWPKWLELLQPDSRRALRAKLDDLKNARLEPDPLEFTNFSDVVHALAQQPDFAGGFKAEMEEIRNLRNDIAHAKTYISLAVDVPRFVDRFTYIRAWIDRASRILKAAQ
jgi:CBS domain